MNLSRKGESIKQRKTTTHTHTGDSVVITIGKGVGERENRKGKGDINGDGRRCDLQFIVLRTHGLFNMQFLKFVLKMYSHHVGDQAK